MNVEIVVNTMKTINYKVNAFEFRTNNVTNWVKLYLSDDECIEIKNVIAIRCIH